MNFKWFFSKTVRQANDMLKHVRKIFDAQCDILSPQAVNAVKSAMQDMHKAIAEGAGDEALQKQMSNLEAAANKWLKPYPNAGVRENVEVLLVALAVAMGIRTFILQPFKIPTGSMQPTLFGVTSENMKIHPDSKIPGILTRIYDGVVLGTFYHEQVAEDDGELKEIGPPEHFLRFISKQTIFMQYKGRDSVVAHTFWFTPEDRFDDRAGIGEGQKFHKGENIVKFVDAADDHL